MRPAWTRACLVVGLAVALGPGVGVRGDEALIRFDLALPAETTSGELIWGVTRGGLELGRGRHDIAELIRVGHGGRVSFDARVAASLPEGQHVALAHVCINSDAWQSYVPSFGDVFQVAATAAADGRWVARFTSEGWQVRAAGSQRDVLTIHYHRPESDYDNASLWTWDEHLQRAPEANEIHPVGRDDFGLVFQLDTGLYGSRGDRIGLLPRLNADWQFKDGQDRFWSPEMGQEVYLVQERNEVYPSKPDVRPQLAAASMEADRSIAVRFTHRLPVGDWPAEKLALTTSTGEAVGIVGVKPVRVREGLASSFVVELAEPMDPASRVYELTVEGIGRRVVRPGGILLDPDRFFDPDARLGATCAKEQTVFRVFAPTASAVRLVVADHPQGDAGVRTQDMIRNDKGVWEATVEGDLAGRFYAYRLGGFGFDANAEIVDIYATCTQGRHSRSLIVDPGRTDPEGFRDGVYRAPLSPADAVIYEMHVRDFTIAADSGVERKGKYLGLSEAGTHLPDDPAVRTGIEHLVELGVTHVQLMPVQDFDNDETEGDPYNWGYMPVSFNSPDGWYATSAAGPAKIRELKSVIKAFHDRGIGVILDVVYNHTAAAAGFERLVPGYYFRMTDDGGFSNGSGCGNEFNSAAPMARKFILDSVRYWVEEYRVDGFRFDLMGLTDLETMRQIRDELRKLRPDILIYGEPWAAGKTLLRQVTNHQRIRGTGIGAFNDHLRDAIKGDKDGGPGGFIQVGDRVESIKEGLRGAIHDWSLDPIDSINYFECHDNLTAWDKLLQSTPEAEDQVRKRMMRLAALILMTSQGMPFLHSGQEFCRSKQGHHNSYNLPDKVNRIDWSFKRANADVFAYHRGLIALRRAHPVFRLRTRQQVDRRVSIDDKAAERCIVCRLDGSRLVGESAQAIFVLLNGNAAPVAFKLPEGVWHILVDADRAGAETLGEASGEVSLPAHSGMVLSR